jgi:hypothetical protein
MKLVFTRILYETIELHIHPVQVPPKDGDRFLLVVSDQGRAWSSTGRQIV